MNSWSAPPAAPGGGVLALLMELLMRLRLGLLIGLLGLVLPLGGLSVDRRGLVGGKLRGGRLGGKLPGVVPALLACVVRHERLRMGGIGGVGL